MPLIEEAAVERMQHTVVRTDIDHLPTRRVSCRKLCIAIVIVQQIEGLGWAAGYEGVELTTSPNRNTRGVPVLE
ncbi:MAG: hypothetical protein U1F26_11385 [Lysobacterales bacterium]